MTEILEFKKDSLSASELEARFYQELDEFVVRYEEKGMTPSWIAGCIGNYFNQLSTPDE